MQDVATGCRDQTAARAVLADLTRRCELVKARVISPRDDQIATHQDTPLAEHMEAWLSHLAAKGVTPLRVKTNRQRFTCVATDCGFQWLADLDGAELERWMLDRAKQGMSAGARNGYREACVAFANRAVRTKRLPDNPFAFVPKADTKVDCRRKRRALTEEELMRLLDAARRRPLLDAMSQVSSGRGPPSAQLLILPRSPRSTRSSTSHAAHLRGRSGNLGRRTRVKQCVRAQRLSRSEDLTTSREEGTLP
jgi:hypothetical protein